MSGLTGRVRALERQGRLAAGCTGCGGRDVHILEPGEAVPPWLDESSCCGECGKGVKGYYRDLWDRL